MPTKPNADFWDDCPITAIEVKLKRDVPTWRQELTSPGSDKRKSVELFGNLIIRFSKTVDALPVTTFDVTLGTPCLDSIV